MTYMKLKKKLKDPNEKSAIQKIVGGKIPHYLAVAAFLYALVNGGFSILDWIRSYAIEQSKNERIEKYIQAIVDKEVMMRFPQRSGPVLRNQIDNQKWVDFINKDKKNGSTNP